MDKTVSMRKNLQQQSQQSPAFKEPWHDTINLGEQQL